MKNKYFEYLNFCLMSEILYEKLDVDFLDLKKNPLGTAWIAKMEYVNDDGSVVKTTMTINEFEATGDDPKVQEIRKTVRKYLLAAFPEDYKKDLCRYEINLDMMKINGASTPNKLVR